MGAPRIIVLGAGLSGQAAALLAVKNGGQVTLVDASSNLTCAARLESEGVRCVFGVNTLPGGPFDLGIVSPGFSLHDPWVVELGRRGVEVVGEMEYGFRNAAFPVLAVTGSNGKSTVTRFLADCMEGSGRVAVPCGNFGRPLSDLVLKGECPDWAVAETSSFQLETISRFAPRIAVFLNIHPNHLDRHGTEEVYFLTKTRIFQALETDAVGVVPVTLLSRIRAAADGRPNWVTFGAGGEGADWTFEGGRVFGPGGEIVDVGGTFWDNPVLGPHVAACCAALKAAGIALGDVEQVARRFGGLPHRMQRVGSCRGVAFINDSKATSLRAMEGALRMLPGKVRLIAGGKPKETDFTIVKEILAEKVSAVYLIGVAAREMEKAWSVTVPCVVSGTLSEAVNKAWRDALAERWVCSDGRLICTPRGEKNEGTFVLLSPACASFDQFKNFEERGDAFIALSRRIIEDNKE